jgi:hypothetical protein
MGPHPVYTQPWPESAFKPPTPEAPARPRAGSSGSSGSESSARRRAASLLRPSKARHLSEAARFANPVIESYMHAEDYSDYRGIAYKARGSARRVRDWLSGP